MPLLLLYFVYRGLADRGYWRSLPQRFGFLPRSFRQTGPGVIWLHAVSVGEVSSCVEFLRTLRSEFPRSHLFVSTSTLAGRATAEDKLHGLADGIFFAPADYVFAVRRVLRTLRPSVLVVAETEIWPNLFRELKRTQAALAIVNGRLSDRALPRYLRYRWFFRTVLPAVDLFLIQSEELRKRFIAIGAPEDRVGVGGNFKYDFDAGIPRINPAIREFLDRARPGKVWIAASTMPAEAGVDEDAAVIAAFRELRKRHPDLLLILAPRKPASFEDAAHKLEAAGVPFARRSALGVSAGETAQALLLDTIGELSSLFAEADVVFMGGTLAARGGHNILEPAFFGKAVIIGPHMENFQAIADQFRAARACVEIASAADLAGAVERLLAFPEESREMGRRARAAAEGQRGASARAAQAVRELFLEKIPHYLPAQPWRAIARALSHIWEWAGEKQRAEDLRAQRRLDRPVISVGNITMGGTGKTPCVLWLAEALKRRGIEAGILTRGYARSSPEEYLTLAPGAAATVAQSGDEPQIFLRSGLAPVGIGPDRWVTGSLLLSQFAIRVLLLDDGFQHMKLRRDVNLLLIDALNPFGGGEVFPLGRLREPIAALERADIVLITRTRFSDLAPAIERELRRWNPRAPVFHASVRPAAWVENRTGAEYSIAERPFQEAGAFCGVGNPQSFRRTLEKVGVSPVEWLEFEDHHRYRPRQLRRIAHEAEAQGATALVTTEKDVMNLCEACDDLLAPLPLYWLKVGMEIEREEEFLGEIEKRMSDGRR